MKKNLILATAILTVASLLTSCGGSDLKGFKKTENGLNYKFHTKTENPRAEIGDIITAEIWIYTGDSLAYTNAGKPEPLYQVEEPQHNADMMEALMMLGEGDSATFAFNFDTLMKYNPGMPNETGEKYFFFTIKVHGVHNLEEFEAKAEADRIAGEAEEAERLAAYISEKGITQKPNNDGVYMLVTTKGTGAVAASGKMVSMNYTGRLLNGKVFDTSFEDVAKENEVYFPERTYAPLEFPIGVGQMIPGLDNALLNAKAGTKATLIIPSAVAYGGRAQGDIPAYSTLIFDVEIVAVK